MFHFTLTEDTIAQLNDLANASPAVKLLNDYFGKSLKERTNPGHFNEMGRFKAMCIIDDIETHGFPSFISKFNGKPVLINKSGWFSLWNKVSLRI